MKRIVGSAAVIAALVLAALVAGTAFATRGGSGPPVNPYSPAVGHAYRHGVEPTVSQARSMKAWAATRSASSIDNLAYGGGVDGIGVTTGTEKVYLVFWGSQWGTQSTDGSGYFHYTGDPVGEAPYLQKLFKGLGTGGETWSGVMTQYCEGISAGAMTCPSTAAHVAYPTGGPLAGVWEDTSSSAPGGTTSESQLASEAVNAAKHFGNTTAAANRDAQYVILSPHNGNPDNWLNSGFCAWHDYTGDIASFTSPYDELAFTNMPYVTDAGASCGQGFVNSPGTLDGISIVEGHEYAETITDQLPAGGWTNQNFNSADYGEENADQCAWNQGPGAPAQNLTLSTGTFAMQSTWGNDLGQCEFSHSIVGGGGTGSSPPTISCPSADGNWHNANVTLTCTATDNSGSGFGTGNTHTTTVGLSTTVAAGTETSNASTGSQSVCDNDGDCATAGPISGNMIDRKAPSVAISAPSGSGTTSSPASAGTSLNVGFSATDGGSGVTSWTLTRYKESLVGSSCSGSWSVDHTATGSSGGSSLSDSETLSVGSCYEWKLTATDAVANAAPAVTSEVVTPRAASITASPTSLSFGLVRVGSNKNLTDTITNTGGSSVTLTSIAVTGSGFARAGGTCSTAARPRGGATSSLAGGASCTIVVRFSPRSRTSYSGTLSVTGGNTVTVPLSGTGR